MINIRLRKINYCKAKNLRRRHTVNKMCESRGIKSQNGRKGMYKIYDYLYKFCYEISHVYG